MKKKIVEMCKAISHHLVAYFIHWLGIVSIGLAVTWFKAYRDQSQGIDYYYKTAIEWVTPLTISALAVALASVLFYAIKLRKLNSGLQAGVQVLENNVHMLGNFGIRAFSSHSTTEEKVADWKMICEDIQNASIHESPLWILGATGKKTFADSDSPLHQVIAQYKGKISVLLLLPYSGGFNYRISQLGENSAVYLEEILDSIDCCKKAKLAGVNVELKLYAGMPIWKLLLMPQAIWLQHYRKASHVDNTPLYGFNYVAHKPNLLEGYRSVFEKRWNHDGSINVDLLGFERKVWVEELKKKIM